MELTALHASLPCLSCCSRSTQALSNLACSVHQIPRVPLPSAMASLCTAHSGMPSCQFELITSGIVATFHAWSRALTNALIERSINSCFNAAAAAAMTHSIIARTCNCLPAESSRAADRALNHRWGRRQSRGQSRRGSAT